MLRVYFLQHWFKLSDPSAENALCESPVRRFAGVDLGRAAAPDEGTILRSRVSLDAHQLDGRILDVVNLNLHSQGIRISTGRIVDSTIIAAPNLMKNQRGERGLEMHQAKRGNQYYPGVQGAHRRGKQRGIVHSACASAASVYDVHLLPDLLHGKEKKVWGDPGYQGQGEALRQAAPKAQVMTCQRTKFRGYVDEEARRKNRTKSRVRAKLDWPSAT